MNTIEIYRARNARNEDVTCPACGHQFAPTTATEEPAPSSAVVPVTITSAPRPRTAAEARAEADRRNAEAKKRREQPAAPIRPTDVPAARVAFGRMAMDYYRRRAGAASDENLIATSPRGGA